DLGIVSARRRTTSTTTYPRLGIDNYVRSNDAGSQGRHEAKNGSRGITARICYQPCSFDTLAVTLAQSIYCCLQQSRCGMNMLVPLFIKSGIAQAKIG